MEFLETRDAVKAMAMQAVANKYTELWNKREGGK